MYRAILLVGNKIYQDQFSWNRLPLFEALIDDGSHQLRIAQIADDEHVRGCFVERGSFRSAPRTVPLALSAAAQEGVR
jgi:hypothetical protein